MDRLIEGVRRDVRRERGLRLLHVGLHPVNRAFTALGAATQFVPRADPEVGHSGRRSPFVLPLSAASRQLRADFPDLQLEHDAFHRIDLPLFRWE